MYQSLQGCRGVAAALVVLFHLGGTFAQDKYFGFKALDGPFAWGDAGVDFFFVLSGFLITIVHRRDFGHPRALGRYLFKRTLRIYPTYWLICAAIFLSAVAVPSLRQALPTDAFTALVALTLVPQDPAVVGGTGSPILFVAWSLQYEMLFYAIFAVFIVSRIVGALVVAALLAAFVGCRLGSACSFPLTFLTSGMICLFAMGVATAYAARSSFRLPFPRLSAVVGAAAFVAFGAAVVSLGPDWIGIDRRLVFGLISCLIILALVQAEDAGTLVAKQPGVRLLGDASYALYLIHIPIISLLVKLVARLGVSGPVALIAAFAAIFAACVGAALLFHLWIERPMLDALRSWLGKSARHRPGAVEAPGVATLGGSRHESLR